MPLFQIGVTFFEYAAWLYSGMSAVEEEFDDLLAEAKEEWLESDANVPHCTIYAQKPTL